MDGLSIEVDETEVERSSVPSVPPRPSLPPPLAVILRYEVLGRAAVGGMAEIYYANERTPTGAVRPVALKVVRYTDGGPDDLQEMFNAEGRLAMRLAHPGICHVYDFGRLGEELFIAMEWVDGAPWGEVLRAVAKKGELFDPVIAAAIAARTAGALHYAHTARDERGRRSGVVHRDVSPQNVMIRFDGAVKLVDFGVAKDDRDRARETGGGDHIVKGKFAYLSPEQVLGHQLDGRSDVFSLGVCLWEALTRRRLFKRKNEIDTLDAILNLETPSTLHFREDIPEALDEIVLKATRKEPADRYASAQEMEEALLSFIAERREVVSSARIADLMRTTLEKRYEEGPALDRSDEIVARMEELAPLTVTSEAPPPIAAPVPMPTAEPRAPSTRRPALAIAAIASVALLMGGIGVAIAWPSEPSETRAPPEIAVQRAPDEEAAAERAAAERAAAERAADEEAAAEQAAEQLAAEQAAEQQAAEQARRRRHERRRNSTRIVTTPDF